ncbi:hypothetical protein [Cellulosimicrobium composti]|uniref:hypothetical protein n=1 Tax=Cellulosimicrobium composti TaxID=2672572 RepID=UPI003787DE50
MTAWIYNHLPGNTFWRTMQCAVLLTVVLVILFVWVFPTVTAHLTPLGDPALTTNEPAPGSPTSTEPG